MVSTAAFHARARSSVPGLRGLKETKMFLPHPRVKLSIVGSLRDREVACSALDRQGSNYESCDWTTVSSHSSHHPQEVLLAQFSLCVHKGGLKPDSFHFISMAASRVIPGRCIYPADPRCSPNVGIMLGQRRRRWTIIVPTLGERLAANSRRGPNVELILIKLPIYHYIDIRIIGMNAWGFRPHLYTYRLIWTRRTFSGW